MVGSSFIDGFGYHRLTQNSSKSWNSCSICFLDLGKMGKRKGQKTKELSVAIAEASSSAAEAGDEAKSPVVTPRKRGRPRKIVEAKQEEEQQQQQQQRQQQQNPIQQAAVAEEEEAAEDKVVDQTEKARTGEVEEQKQGMLQESSSTRKTSSRSRARKKSKPRKSS